MIDLITKENSFYAIYNEPFGDILKTFFIKSPSPAMIGMVADAPAPVDKDVTQIAKNVVQFAAQRIEISGVKDGPKQIVADLLNEIDRQLKAKQLTNGIICCSVLVVYDEYLYVGGVGDCTIALCNEQGILRFCHDSPNEPRPVGVESCSIAPAESIGLNHDARLGDLPKPYTMESVYQVEVDQSMKIYMFSDGLTKHISDFFMDLLNQKPEEVFSRVSRDIPKDTELLHDDICFTVIDIPTELAPKKLNYPPQTNSFENVSKDNGKKQKLNSKPKSIREPKEKNESSGAPGFWILFMMLLFIMFLIVAFGFWAVYEWYTFKEQFFDIIKR